jgi:hypothetical protein
MPFPANFPIADNPEVIGLGLPHYEGAHYEDASSRSHSGCVSIGPQK